MKAIVISEENDILNKILSSLSDVKIDLILYRWFLKAMDNLEEIRPDYVFLSAEEFPRQWKVLAGYLQGIDTETTVFLFDADSLSDDDKKKVEGLASVKIFDEKFSFGDTESKSLLAETSVSEVSKSDSPYPAIISNVVDKNFFYSDISVSQGKICVNDGSSFSKYLKVMKDEPFKNDFIISYFKDDDYFTEEVRLINVEESKAEFHEKE